MSDFESSLQKWLLIFIVGIAITVSAMNYWYKTLPERMARESASQAPPAVLPARDKTPANVPAISATGRWKTPAAEMGTFLVS